MVWSDDLAKLKQSLKADEGKSPHAQGPPAKARPQPVQAQRSLEEEDAVFLTAMGRAAAQAPRADDARGGDGFGSAMRDLGGVRPLGAHGAGGADAAQAAKKTDDDVRGNPNRSEAPPAPKKVADTAPVRPGHREATLALLGPDDDVDDPRAAPGAASGAASGTEPVRPHTVFPPERIQLAAGMTIEVDSVLDLRKHNEADAGERLKERVLDGACLGWRAMHVILGNSEPLRQVLLGYVSSSAAHPLSKYGEAPVPMGGQQAWILYFGQVPTQDLDHEAARP